MVISIVLRFCRASGDIKSLLPMCLCPATVECLTVGAAHGNVTLLQAHRLRVVLDADDMAFRDTTAHEYNLDDIKVGQGQHWSQPSLSAFQSDAGATILPCVCQRCKQGPHFCARLPAGSPPREVAAH